MRCEFIKEVQLLMDIQQIKIAENRNERKTNYDWLCSKRISFGHISIADEWKIRHALTKINADEQVKVMKQLLMWLEANPQTDPSKIPEETRNLINHMVIQNVIHKTNFSRISSFRSSLRRLSIISNKVSPAPMKIDYGKSRRSVSFNDIPVIYRISK